MKADIRLRPGGLRHLLVIDQSVRSDWEPTLTVRHLQELPKIQNVVLGASLVHSCWRELR